LNIFCWSKRALCKPLVLPVLTWPWNSHIFLYDTHRNAA
jgi:hypothetical protein